MRVARGRTLRLVNTAGSSGVLVPVRKADDTSERYNAGDTVKLQWTKPLTHGRAVLGYGARPLFTADNFGANDTILGGSTLATNACTFGDASLRNSRDNFPLAAASSGFIAPTCRPRSPSLPGSPRMRTVVSTGRAAAHPAASLIGALA